jgi:hypothetical protein
VYVEAPFTDPVLAAQIGRLHPGLVLLQDRNDLLFRMPLALHRLVLSKGQTPIHFDQFKGATSALTLLTVRPQRGRSIREMPHGALCGVLLPVLAGDPDAGEKERNEQPRQHPADPACRMLVGPSGQKHPSVIERVGAHGASPLAFVVEVCGLAELRRSHQH